MKTTTLSLEMPLEQIKTYTSQDEMIERIHSYNSTHELYLVGLNMV